ncbi:MAG TPA: BrxE family protein [Polyangiaceae bacterium]|nr:BrxE family protein [Polyangiaceae bacterium]
MTAGAAAPVDLDRLLKLRLVVARFGEMDLARWWNSKGMLGRHGAVVLKRGFPATHHFAQARVVFAVARSRCEELFNPPGCMTLWNLPAEVEEAFEERWQDWLDEGERWAPLFERLAVLKDGDLIEAMSGLELLTSEQRDATLKLRRSAEGRAVPLPGTHRADDGVITLLAAGFARGEAGSPAIPYARLEG